MLHRDRVTQVEVGLLGRLGEMAGPVLFVVDHDTSSLRELLSDLTRRFGDDFTVKGDSSPEAALVALQEMASADEPVALMLVGGSPTEFLARAHELHPHAQRVLLIPWSNRSASKPVLRMISQGRIDRYTTVPSRSPDENFHYVVTELLRDWQQQHPDRQTVVTLIDQRWSPRSYQIRDLLQRGGLPLKGGHVSVQTFAPQQSNAEQQD